MNTRKAAIARSPSRVCRRIASSCSPKKLMYNCRLPRLAARKTGYSQALSTKSPVSQLTRRCSSRMARNTCLTMPMACLIEKLLPRFWVLGAFLGDSGPFFVSFFSNFHSLSQKNNLKYQRHPDSSGWPRKAKIPCHSALYSCFCVSMSSRIGNQRSNPRHTSRMDKNQITGGVFCAASCGNNQALSNDAHQRLT